jgi:hypothetical protein
VITISFPDISRGRREQKLPHVEGKSLRLYFKEVGIVGMRLRCHVLRAETRERLPSGYAPRDGEKILLELAGR